MHYVLTNLTLVNRLQTYQQAYLEIKNGLICSFGSKTQKPNNIPVYDALGWKVFPGFIDCHTHGGYGISFESAQTTAYQKLSRYLPSEGVTSFLLSGVSNGIEQMLNVVRSFTLYVQQPTGAKQARCWGFHLEGPFLAYAKKGAHKADYLQTLNWPFIHKLVQISQGYWKMCTYALELDTQGLFLRFLQKHNIIAAAGHSNASKTVYYTNGQAFGLSHATHLFNAMSGCENHKIGIAGCVLNDPNVLAELICDNNHVDIELVKIAYMCKGYQKLCLITDAISAKGLADGFYFLGELAIEKKNNICLIAHTNKLAGSCNYYVNCWQTFKNITNASDQALVYIASYNVAQQFGWQNYVGDIQKNLYADLVFVDANYQLQATIIGGVVAYFNPNCLKPKHPSLFDLA